MYLRPDVGALRLWGAGAAVLAAGFLFAAPAGADTVHPKDDAYVDLKSDLLTKKFGSSTKLLIRSSSKGTQVFLRFDLTSLPAGTVVEQALLRLYVASVATAGDIQVHLVDENWTENRIKGSNRPLLTTLLTTVPIAKSKKRNFITIDLTPEVQDWLAFPEGVLISKFISFFSINVNRLLRPSPNFSIISTVTPFERKTLPVPCVQMILKSKSANFLAIITIWRLS